MKYAFEHVGGNQFQSLSLRRAWIEILVQIAANQGAEVSLSLRRAWIEITGQTMQTCSAISRSPYGERGLKLSQPEGTPFTPCRSPYGERGLKSFKGTAYGAYGRVALLTESVD